MDWPVSSIPLMVIISSQESLERYLYVFLSAVKYLNVSTMVLIVRCPRAYYRAVWTSISGVTSYDGEPCSLALLHIGGTIRSCQKALIRYNTRVLREAVISSGDDMGEYN